MDERIAGGLNLTQMIGCVLEPEGFHVGPECCSPARLVKSVQTLADVRSLLEQFLAQLSRQVSERGEIEALHQSLEQRPEQDDDDKPLNARRMTVLRDDRRRAFPLMAHQVE